jgi:hypothetical protein
VTQSVALKVIGSVWAFVVLSVLPLLRAAVTAVGNEQNPRNLYLGSRLLTLVLDEWFLVLVTFGGLAAMLAFFLRYRWGLYVAELLSLLCLVTFPWRFALDVVSERRVDPFLVLALAGQVVAPLCMIAICLLPSIRSAMNR